MVHEPIANSVALQRIVDILRMVVMDGDARRARRIAHEKSRCRLASTWAAHLAIARWIVVHCIAPFGDSKQATSRFP
jgi:hypothetical protein